MVGSQIEIDVAALNWVSLTYAPNFNFSAVDHRYSLILFRLDSENKFVRHLFVCKRYFAQRELDGVDEGKQVIAFELLQNSPFEK